MDELQQALEEMDSALNICSQWSALVAIAKALHILADGLKGEA
jgi:hypothetical protein